MNILWNMLLGLAEDGNQVLEEDDISFLKKWSPAPILTAEPSIKARDEFKRLLLLKYGRPVKAWPSPEGIDLN